MMKKLLVLMLVLGLASLVNAGMVLTVPATGTVNVPFDVVISGTGLGVGVTIDGGIYGGGAALITGNTIAPAAGVSGLVGSYNSFLGYETTVGELVDDGDALNDPLDGTWITFSASSAVAGIYTFDLYDYATSASVPIASGSIDVLIPEPMTMALLGLGGLFLRRRK